MLVRFDTKILAATVALACVGHLALAQPGALRPVGTTGNWTGRVLGDAATNHRAVTYTVTIASVAGPGLLGLGSVHADAGGIQNINGDYTNNTTLTASGTTDPQTININNSTFTQTGGGVLNAANGGLITLNSVNVVGGTLTTSGSGTITASNNGNNFLTGVTLAGTLDLASNTSIERVRNGLTFGMGGTINVNSNSILAIEGNQTLGGTGTIVFGATGSGNRLNIESPSGTATLTVGSNVTIHGANGTIGGQNFEGGPNALVNNGTIRADVSGGTITIVNAAVSNNGALQAANGGTLSLQSAVTNTGAGQITATNGGVIVLNGTSITGGTISTSGGGLFQASNSGNNFANSVSVKGGVDLASNTSILRVAGSGMTLQGNATVNINNNSILAFEGNTTLGGTGTVVFGATGSGNRLNIESPGGPGTLTIGPNVTIRGQNGTIGGQNFEGGPNALVNNGTISADVATGTITIVNAPVTNNGTLSAANGGTLVLNSNVTGNAGSQIVSGAGSVVLQNGVIVAGQVNTNGSGSFQAANSGNNFFNAVALNGALDLATNTSIERVTSGLTLQNGATINLNSNSILAIEGTQTLGGTGTIVLGGTGSGNRVNIESPNSMTGTLTVGANITIRGTNGTIGGQNFEGGPNALVNNGTIAADVSGGTITIVNAPVTNHGTLEAINGGTLVFNSNVTGTTGSHIIAGAKSVVFQNGVTLSGQINTSGSGLVQAANSGNNFFNAVTFSGNLDLASNTSIERVTSGLTLQDGATINLNSNSILAIEGSQTLGGTGTIVFGATGSGNRLNIESPSGTATLTVGSNVTIHGANGTIGGQNFEGGANAFVNNGTINADGGGTITVVNAPVTNNGTLRAQNGTLTLNTPLNGTGTLQVDAAGVVNLASNAPVTQGTLAIGAAGATLNNGTQNITLSADYTNASAGVGNAFNRHAGITGTGQILAGGNVAQAITGSGVTNGTTSNATLTIGNVRVGANTITYNVANTGTTGPALRGAVQTSVNGGNITDSRLSGGGVTSSNYGPVAPGSAGTQNVVFTATSAGRLAPLSGQAVNLRSTYDNIGDQKLNIVLGNGAAAYAAAAGQLNTPALNFGTVQVGQSVSQTLSFTNTATGPAGYVEDLNVGFGQTTGTGGSRISGSGSITDLRAGSTNGSSMVVTVNTSSAGTVNGAIGINYASTGTVNGVSNGLGVLALPGTNYGVIGTIHGQGNVVDQARAVINTPTLNLGAARVGGAALAGVVSVTNQATGNQQAALNASIAGNAPITGNGSFTLLGPGATNNSALHVGLGTGTAGIFGGTATVNFVSDASNIGGCGSNCQMTLASQNVNVTGKVYTTAVGQVGTTTVDFGIVHVGDAVAARGLAVTNGATATALNDVLRGGVTTGSAGFKAAGTLGGLAAGASDNSTLTVGLNTAATGRFTGSAAVGLASHDADLADLALGTSNVALTGQVNNYAAAGFTRTGGAGTLAQLTARTFTLDFGNLVLGSGSATASLAVNNVAQGFADFLNGTYSVTGSGFTLGGFNPFTNIAAGGSVGGLQVAFNGATAGMFSEVITLNGYGTNASGYSATIAPVTLTLRGTVGGTVVTPEPSTWALVAAGLAGVGVAARRRRRTGAAA